MARDKTAANTALQSESRESYSEARALREQNGQCPLLSNRYISRSPLKKTVHTLCSCMGFAAAIPKLPYDTKARTVVELLMM